jgi:hypothetical protein
MDQKLAKCASLEASWRRRIPKEIWRQVLCHPQVRELVVASVQDTIKSKDVLANVHVLAGVLDVFPDRVPSGYIIADALELLDKFHGGGVFPLDMASGDEASAESVGEKRRMVLRMADLIKSYMGFVRRLFRRSKHSRSAIDNDVLTQGCCLHVILLQRLSELGVGPCPRQTSTIILHVSTADT